MTSKEMVKIAYEALSDKKGQDIKIIDIQPILSSQMEAMSIRFRQWLTM